MNPDKKRTLEYFEKAIQNHEGFMLYLKYVTPNFPGFNEDPRTAIMMKKIGVPFKHHQ